MRFAFLLLFTSVTLMSCPGGPDGAAPRAAIASPATNASLIGQGTAQITAADDNGVTRVRLFAQAIGDASSRVALGSAVIAPYVISFDTRQLPNASEVELVAVAEDAAGQTGESDPVKVRIANTDVPSLVGVYAFTLAPRDTPPSAVQDCANPTASNATNRLVRPASLTQPTTVQPRAAAQRVHPQETEPYDVVLEWEWNAFGGAVSTTNGYGVYCSKKLTGPYALAVRQSASTQSTQKFSKTVKASVGERFFGLVTPITQNATLEGGYSNADSTTVLPLQQVTSPEDGATIPDGRPLFTYTATPGTIGYFLQVYDKNPLTDDSARQILRLPSGSATTDALSQAYPSNLAALSSGTYFWWVAGVSFNAGGKADAVTYSKPRTLVVP
jgi:hypothetical protein